MLDLSKDIDSLSRFKRKTSDFIRRMRRTGHPVVLTRNGKAELVVQDTRSYQKLLDLADRAEAVQGIRRGLEQVRRGEGRGAGEFFAEMRQKYDLPR